MRAIRPNPYLNFCTHQNGLVIAWTNKTIRSLTKKESETFQEISQGRFAVSSPEAIRSFRVLLKDGLIDLGLPDPAPAERQSFQEDLFTFLSDGRIDSWTAKKIDLAFRQDIPELKNVHTFYTDRFLQVSVSDVFQRSQGRPVLFLNLFSDCPVIGPLVSTPQDLAKAQSVLSKTWTTAIFAKSLGEYQFAEISLSRFENARLEFTQWNQQNSLDTLRSCLLSFDPELSLQSHQILFELVAGADNMPAEEFRARSLLPDAICTTDGGFRTKEAAHVMAQLRPYQDEITGLADSVEELELQGIYTFRAFSHLQFLLQGPYLNLYAMGKGDSRAQAYSSCMAELLERYFSFVDLIEHPTKIGTSKSILSAIEPEKLLLYSDRQFQSGPQEEGLFFRRIPAPYRSEEIEWIPVYSFSKQKEVWFPREYCYRKPETKARYFLPTSNGLAAGNTYAEAILQGAFELIERDAASIWWYNQTVRTQLDPKKLKIDVVQRCLQYFESKQKTVRILDITSDLGIPCHVALSYFPQVKGSLQLGFGCHFSSRISISRAVNELVQTDAAKRFNMQSASEYSQFFGSENYNETFLNPVQCNEWDENPISETALDQVLWRLIQLFEQRGLDLHVLNFSYLNHPIKVVRSMIPGLRSMMYEMGPGRLYTVPVEMGHLKQPKGEMEMNTYCLDI
jgi:thiazole/oxazole-forming peptide maturase SagD family component